MAGQDRHDLSDAQWKLLEPLLPERGPRRGGRWLDHRVVVDGIRWRVRTGSPWRDLPGSYGHWETVYGRHRRWSADGTWVRVLDALRAGADHDPDALDAAGRWVVSVDSTVVRAHADAAGARHAPPKDVAADLLEDLAGAVPAGPARARPRDGPTEPAPSTSSRSSSPAERAATSTLERGGGVGDAAGGASGGKD